MIVVVAMLTCPPVVFENAERASTKHQREHMCRDPEIRR